MKSICTELTVDAPPERVWDVLSRFERYSLWNPFLRRIDGVAGANQPLRIVAKLAGLPPVSFTARMVTFQRHESLGWQAVFLFGLFRAHHFFELHPVESGGRTRLVHCETFDGLLCRPVLAVLSRAFRQRYEAMNRALQECVEQK